MPHRGRRHRRSEMATWALAVLALIVLLSGYGWKEDGRKTASASSAGQQPTTVAAASDPASYPPDIRAIVEKGAIVVQLYKEDRPPFFYTNERGELAGSDIDLARGIAAKLGVEPVFDRSAATFDDIVDRVAQGKADIAVSKLSVTLSRARKVKFTSPYLVLNQALLINRVKLAETRRENDDIAAVIDQTGARIGVREGTSFVDYAKQQFPHAKLTAYADTERMIADLEKGDLLAVLYDENEIKRAIYMKPERAIALKISMLSDHKDPLAIAVAPGRDQLLYWLNLYLELENAHLNIDDLLKTYGNGTGGSK